MERVNSAPLNNIINFKNLQAAYHDNIVVSSCSQSDRTQTTQMYVCCLFSNCCCCPPSSLRLFFVVVSNDCRAFVSISNCKGGTLKNSYNCRVFCLHYHISFRFISIISLLKLCHENESKSNTAPTPTHTPI